MWRDERQLKINDLLVACQASVDDYEQAAQLVESPSLAEWLRAVARYREHLIPLLEEQVRELNDLPRVPDPEVQLWEQALTRFKAALPTGGRQQVLDERFQDDQEMLALAQSARKEALPKASLSVLDELITHLDSTLGALAKA
ncbi:MAG: hypothetical protein WAN46_19390 [Gammaproteobacteria bacterium]